jgi:hypothetical protein
VTVVIRQRVVNDDTGGLSTAANADAGGYGAEEAKMREVRLPYLITALVIYLSEAQGVPARMLE